VRGAAARRPQEYAKLVLPPSERSVNPFPERIGRYELLLPIGTGGMATVFLGRATGVGRFERDVAVKVIHAHLRSDEESKELLLEEARLAARIRHANVVPVLEVGDDPFGIYLVLDYVEGDSLAGLMREVKAAGQKIPLPIVARIMVDALDGLHAAHELKDDSGKTLGLVHRDFSPQNILIGIDGVTKLADFSVAKAGDRAIRTRTGLVKGKIGYMSPEQARGHQVDRRCDVWAAGVVAWELVAWRRLHKNSDAVATLLNIVTEAPPLLGDVMPDAPKALEEVIFKALTMDVAARTPSAVALRKDLEQAFRSVGPIAEPREVGEYAAAIFGQKLRERSEAALEIQKLRARMGEIARPSSSEAPTFGTPESDPSPESGSRTRADAPAVLAARELDVSVADGSVAKSNALGGVPANSPADLSSATSLEIDAFVSRTDKSRVRTLAAAGVALLAVAIAGVWLTRRGAPEPSEPAAALRSASVTQVPANAVAATGNTVEPTPRPVALDSLEPASDTETVAPDSPKTAPETSGSNAPSARARQRKPAPVAAPTIAAPKSKVPQKLARDPYGDLK
jgi:eukaryotic-like serine/threonine-protein kinase